MKSTSLTSKCRAYLSKVERVGFCSVRPLLTSNSNDLPFDNISDLPDVFTTYRKSLEPLREKPRRHLKRPEKLPPFPADSQIPPSPPYISIPDTESSFVEALLSALPKDLDLKSPPTWPEDDDVLAKSAHPLVGGESSAINRLKYLVTSGAIGKYKETRNGLLGVDFSTKLAAYFVIGCLTARFAHAIMVILEDGEEFDGNDEQELLEEFRLAPGFGKGEDEGTAGVRFELLWRDYMRLCARKFGDKLFQLEGFRGIKDKQWQFVPGSSSAESKEKLERFLSGHTGIGLIDASQRELFWTGYSSNRARQNVASFLAKHLNIDWRLGAEWYECMLVDYDVASNWGNWQYVSGVGNDPREGRIFNPIKQALDYDSKGEYIKTWIPELRGLEVEDEDGSLNQEKLMGLYQPWRIDAQDREKLKLDNLDWVNSPLVKIQFSVGKRPRPNPRGRGGYRGRGRGWGRGRGRGGPPGPPGPPFIPV
jgi:cryptochrome